MPPHQPTRTSLLLTLIALPAIAFYSILTHLLTNNPGLDDYDALLGFLNTFRTTPHPALYFLTALHGEYRLFFEHAILLLQLYLLGHISFSDLAALGNLSVLLLAAVLWRIFLPQLPLGRRLTLFLPVPFLLFQLQYFEDLDYSMTALQNLPVVPFLLATLLFLHRAGNKAFAAALLTLTLTVAASGNGLFLIFIGAAVLLQQRRPRALAAWSTLSLALLAAYFFRYPFAQLLHHPAATHHSVLTQFLVRKPIFFLAFLGSAAGHPIHAASVALGLALLALFAWLIQQRYPQRNPLVAWSVFSVLFTAAGVAYTRAEYGVFGAISSRYGLYSDLLLILSWFALAELFLAQADSPAHTPLFRTALIGSILFALGMDVYGTRQLTERNAQAAEGMRLFRTTHAAEGPVVLPPGFGAELTQSINQQAAPALTEAIAQGTYTPPGPR